MTLIIYLRDETMVQRLQYTIVLSFSINYTPLLIFYKKIEKTLEVTTFYI